MKWALRTRIIGASASVFAIACSMAWWSSAGPSGCFADDDLDGVCDYYYFDNCLGVFNPDQRDDDEDGYGNLCDTDVNQDCITGAPDLAAVFARLGTSAPWTPRRLGAYDVNSDGAVGAVDLSRTFSNLGLPPGPTTKVCADCTAPVPVGTGLGACQ